jgi:ribonuclease Z
LPVTALDGVPEPVKVLFPASGTEFFDRLRRASSYEDKLDVRPVPVAEAGPVTGDERFSIHAERLEHEPETFGWRVEEPAGKRMLPDRLHEAGIVGPAVGELLRQGRLVVGGVEVLLEAVSEHRPGQVMALVMDTGICDQAVTLARGPIWSSANRPLPRRTSISHASSGT